MKLEFNCVVEDMVDSYIPNIKILSMNCGKIQVKMDIHRELSPVEKGDRARLGVYKEVPPYIKGKDFVAHGYVISKRKANSDTKIYISLWGFLIIITTNDTETEMFLNPLDKVYVKLWKES